MATHPAAVDACCPLCQEPILHVGPGGRIEAEDLHPIRLYKNRSAAEGYMVCDECGMLAELGAGTTLN